MSELKKFYFYVKSKSLDFKTSLGNSFTGDELFNAITQFNSLNLVDPTPEDIKLVNKLKTYLQPTPVKVNVVELVGGYRYVEITDEPL